MSTRAGLFFILIAVQVLAPAADGEPVLSSEAIKLHLQAQEMLFNDRFSSVDSLYREYTTSNPTDPSGFLFRAGAILARMLDTEEDDERDAFDALLDTAQALCDSVASSAEGRDLAWLHLFRGHIKAYRSLFSSRFGSFVRALRTGLSSRGDYHAAVEADSTLYDAYFGLGSYHYWKSARSGIFRFLGLFKNEKDKGIRELCRAVESSILSSTAATAGLIWVYLDAEQFDSAAFLAERLVRRYPDGKSFLWPLAEARYKDRRYEEALAVYRQLRDKLEASPGNYYNLIEVDFRICRTLERLKRELLAARAAGELESYRRYIPPETRERQEGRLNYLGRMAGKAMAFEDDR